WHAVAGHSLHPARTDAHRQRRLPLWRQPLGRNRWRAHPDRGFARAGASAGAAPGANRAAAAGAMMHTETKDMEIPRASNRFFYLGMVFSLLALIGLCLCWELFL